MMRGDYPEFYKNQIEESWCCFDLDVGKIPVCLVRQEKENEDEPDEEKIIT